jgi:hypothetical protein
MCAAGSQTGKSVQNQYPYPVVGCIAYS